jgi:hypothetical protein
VTVSVVDPGGSLNPDLDSAFQVNLDSHAGFDEKKQLEKKISLFLIKSCNLLIQATGEAFILQKRTFST